MVARFGVVAALLLGLLVVVLTFARRAQRLGLSADLDPDQAGYFITLR